MIIIKDIYILLTNTGTLFTRTIKFYTKAPYNHTSIGFDIDLDELYSFGRKNPNNPLFAGFVKEDINKGVYEKFINTTCCILMLKVTDAEYYNIKCIIKSFITQKEKYKYNLAGLFGIMVNKPFKRDYHFFCSEFVANVLLKAGLNIFNKDSALVTPQDFLRSEKFSVIYKGMLKDYKCKYDENSRAYVV